MILVSDLVIGVRKETGYEERAARRRVRAKFTLNGCLYRLSITGPRIEERYLTQGDGDYDIGEATLCISLVEVWNGFSYRVVASVITEGLCKDIGDE